MNNVTLTSSDVRQYQQKTCLHLLHIICAHPSSFSIGTAHKGQLFINSEPPGPESNNGNPSSAPKVKAYCSQVCSGCHY